MASILPTGGRDARLLPATANHSAGATFAELASQRTLLLRARAGGQQTHAQQADRLSPLARGRGFFFLAQLAPPRRAVGPCRRRPRRPGHGVPNRRAPIISAWKGGVALCLWRALGNAIEGSKRSERATTQMRRGRSGVVRDLSALRGASIAVGVDTAASFFYYCVVALGVDAVAGAQLAVVASGAPCRRAPSQYLRHARACEEKVTLRVAERLDVEFPCVRVALRRIAREEGSQIVVAAVGAPAPGGVALHALGDVVDWAVAARRVQNELGPKLLSADGCRLRC